MCLVLPICHFLTYHFKRERVSECYKIYISINLYITLHSDKSFRHEPKTKRKKCWEWEWRGEGGGRRRWKELLLADSSFPEKKAPFCLCSGRMAKRKHIIISFVSPALAIISSHTKCASPAQRGKSPTRRKTFCGTMELNYSDLSEK